jgi:SAM-dependent methyltransferase
VDRIGEEAARLERAYERRTAEHAVRYSWFSAAHVWLMQARERDTLRALRQARPEGLRRARILDAGCGSGFWMREFVRWGAEPRNVHGVDLLRSRTTETRRWSARAHGVALANAAALPYRDAAFDIVHQAVMVTSILDEDVRRMVARELTRVAAPTGIILWYDFHVNNPANPDVRRVTRRDLERLFPDGTISFRRVGLAPPVARVVAPLSGWACDALRVLPWLCTHHLAVIRPHRAGNRARA